MSNVLLHPAMSSEQMRKTVEKIGGELRIEYRDSKISLIYCPEGHSGGIARTGG